MATELDYMEYSSDANAQAAYVTNGEGSDVLTGGTASADSIYNATQSADKACDNNDGTWWNSATTGSYPRWWKYDLGAGVAKVVNKLATKAYSGINFNAFKFQGSNNNSDWTDIYSGNGENNTNLQTFVFPNTTAYRYYRLYMTSGYTSPQIALYEISMYERSVDCYSESTIKTQGSYSLKGVATTDALNKTLTRTIGSPINLSGVDTIRFDIRASRTGGNIKIGLHDSGGTTSEKTYSVSSANTWETVVWDISAVADANKDAIDSIIVTITNADSANTFYIDNFLSAENVTVTAEPFIVTTSLSSDGAVIFAGFGYVYEEDSTGAVMDVAVRTGAKIGGNLLKRKALKYIYHMMNTHGKDVTMTIYVDGVAQTPTFTINTTVRKMTRIEDIPLEWAGYVFDIRLTCDDLTDDDLEIYAPCAIEYTPFGV